MQYILYLEFIDILRTVFNGIAVKNLHLPHKAMVIYIHEIISSFYFVHVSRTD